jgi:hypothetical protein
VTTTTPVAAVTNKRRIMLLMLLVTMIMMHHHHPLLLLLLLLRLLCLQLMWLLQLRLLRRLTSLLSFLHNPLQLIHIIKRLFKRYPTLSQARDTRLDFFTTEFRQVAAAFTDRVEEDVSARSSLGGYTISYYEGAQEQTGSCKTYGSSRR